MRAFRYDRSSAGSGDALDVTPQSQTPEHSLGRHNTLSAACQGCIMLLWIVAKNVMITVGEEAYARTTLLLIYPLFFKISH